MAKTFFEALGYRLGQKAAQAKNAFDLMGGTEEESLRAEIRLGRDLAAALLERTVLVQENETTEFAARIGLWLGANVKEKKLPFSVMVTAEREPNALALPGGPVFVSWPLLELCQGQRDDELDADTFAANNTAWFAVSDGVYRYDGYHWRRFTAARD